MPGDELLDQHEIVVPRRLGVGERELAADRRRSLS